MAGGSGTSSSVSASGFGGSAIPQQVHQLNTESYGMEVVGQN